MADQQASQSNWTIQQFAEVAGQPWYVLQEHGPDGVQRQYTGYAHEVAELAATIHVSPRQLPATTEEAFYTSLSKTTRDYELGRQFAADPERGIRTDLGPYDLDRYNAGQQVRTMEDNIRRENQVIQEKLAQAGYSSEQQTTIQHGTVVPAPSAAPENRPLLERTEAASRALVGQQLTPEERENLITEYQGYALDRGAPTAAEARVTAEREVAEFLGQASAFDERFAPLQAQLTQVRERVGNEMFREQPRQDESQQQQTAIGFGY